MKVPTQEDIEYVKGWSDLKLSTGKVSNLLVDQLAHGLINRTLHFHIICDEIGVLEDAPYCRSSNTKSTTEFRREHLRGLWHKHYTEPGHILQNIMLHWGKDFSRFATHIENEITPETVGKIGYDFVMEAHKQRNRAQKMTGEWIVYAVHSGESYYLTLATHKEGDEVIAARVRECAVEFPDLNLQKYI
jgi:hypothetical protein